MGKIVISENITLDGIADDPTGEQGTRHGGWFSAMSEADRAGWAEAEFAEASGASALLLGRGTHDYFVERGWTTQEGPWADRLRALPKYVASSTLVQLPWDNTVVLKGDVVQEVTTLKRDTDGEIVLYGSAPLARVLLDNGLVDQLRLFVFPTVLGDGESLYSSLRDKVALRPVTSRPIGESLLHLSYDIPR